MKEIAAALLLWVNANTTYDYTGPAPEIVATDPETLVYMMLGEVWFIPEQAKMGIKGVYDVETRTIWMRDDFDFEDPRGQSHLVHELVHFVQYQQAGGHRLACGRELEREAYAIQNRFLREHGLEPVNAAVTKFSQSLSSCPQR